MSHLLIIDPQNDFLDIAGAALPVPGAKADIDQTIGFIARNDQSLSAITVTLDSHPAVAIERPGFWLQADGTDVAPFTVIAAQDVAASRFSVRDPNLAQTALDYLRALELGGKYQLMVWPAHCVVGTWGHEMPTALEDALTGWKKTSGKTVFEVRKGQNPMTEQYSAVRAEVPVAGDARTERNAALVAAATPDEGFLFVAGEALSHCVRATMLDLFPEFTPEQLARTVLLTDCMSPVSGFAAQADEFLVHARSLGVRTMTTVQATALLDTTPVRE